MVINERFEKFFGGKVDELIHLMWECGKKRVIKDDFWIFFGLNQLGAW